MRQRNLGLNRETKQEWEMIIRHLGKNRQRLQEYIKDEIEYLIKEIHDVTGDIRFARTKREQIYLQKIGVTLISYKNRLKRLLRP